MKITGDNEYRILTKDDNTIHRICDNDIVKYTGIYYIPDQSNSLLRQQTEATFIGKIECERSRHDTGTTGIYISPMYILYDSDKTETDAKRWYRITNYQPPSQKYFYYPHLLMLPGSFYHYLPLYFLHTVENISLSEFETTTSDIGEIELFYF